MSNRLPVPQDAIAIVGMAGRFPGAENTDALWANLMAGRDGVRRFAADQIHRVDQSLLKDPNYVAARGVVDGAMDFDPGFFGISPMEATVMDPQQRLLIQLTWHLFENAAVNIADSGGRTGVFVGTNWNHYQAHYLRSAAGESMVQRYGELNSAIANEHDFPATRLAYLFDFRGPCINLMTACSTGLVGVCQGVSSLLNFDSDLVVAGGVALNPPANRGYLYNEGGMLSVDGRTRPFDENASGTTFNEGAALVLLKRLQDAQADGDVIHAVVLGSGTNNDGSSKVSFTAPSVRGQADALGLAVAAADVDPATITHIETHGTATPLGDPIEVAAIREVYGSGDKPCLLGSLKGNVGHMIHAAGAGSLIKMAQSLQHQTVPGVQNFVRPNPNLKLEGSRFRINPEPEAWKTDNDQPRRGAVSSFGVGGTNAHVVLQEWPEYRPADPSTSVPALLLSAKTETSLRQLGVKMARHLAGADQVAVADAGYTLLASRQPMPWRGALVGPPNQWEDPGADQEVGADNAHWVAGEVGTADSVVMLFPGQGAQWPGMAVGFTDGLSGIRRDIDRCLSAAGDAGDILHHLLFEAAPDDEQAMATLRQTRLAQPALFAVSFALARYWIDHGITPQGLIGHSVGEFVAATIAGVWQPEQAMQIVCRRGELMQAQTPGLMLAVKASADKLDPFLEVGIELAAVNTSEDCVLAGSADAVHELAGRLQQAGMACQTLATSHAFHSELMQPAAEAFRDYLADVAFTEPVLSIISTVHGRPLTDEEACSPRYWAQQLRQPVNFAGALDAVCELLPQNLLLECGPGQVLSGMARRHGGQSGQHAVASLASPAPAAERALGNAWAALWISGLPLDAEQVYRQEQRRRIPLPGTVFDTQTYCVEAPDGAGSIMNNKVTPAVEAVPVTTQASDAELRSRLRDLIEEYSGVSVAPDQDSLSFLELGLDSLLLTQVSRTVSSEFDVPVSFRDLSERCATVEALVALLAASRPELLTPATAAPTAQHAGHHLGHHLGHDVSEDGGLAAAAAMQQLMSQVDGNNPDLSALIRNQLDVMRMQLAAVSGAGALVTDGPAAGASPGQANSTKPVAARHSLPADLQRKLDSARQRGPGTRIAKASGELSAKQRDRLQQLAARYTGQTAASKAFAQKHRPHFADPRTVSGFGPLWKETVYPIVTRRSSGARLWDIDCNEYLDLTNGFGQILFGHSPDFITQAVKDQIDLGVEIGPQTELAGEVAELLCEITGNERMTFANTGSEAVLAAIRLARTVTNRTRVVSFEQAYHGIFDEVVVRGGKSGQALPGAPGIPRSVSDNVTVLPWAEPEMIDVIRAQADDIAAVLVEPVQSRAPHVQPKDFLKALRQVTQEHGIALIFDEVVTGFRCAPGGAQEYFGIQADLNTYGKILGGGYPIGVVAGRARYMDAMDGGQWQFGDQSTPEVGVTFFAGTFVRHPLAMAASRAVLQRLKEEGPALQEQLNQTTADFCERLNLRMRQIGVPVQAQVFSSVFYFDLEVPFAEVFFNLLRLNGVHIWSHRPCFLTLSHTPEMLDQIIEAFDKSAREMVASELMDAHPLPDQEQFLAENRPAPDARLGRDEDGNPAWYIRDEQGNYQMVASQ